MVPSATPAASAMARVVARAYPTCPTTSVVAWMSLALVRAPRSLMPPPSPSVVRSGRASFGDIATHQGEGGRTEPDGGIGQSEADRRAVAERVGPTAGPGGERAQGDAHDGGDGRGDRGPAGQGEHLAGKQAQTVRLSLYEQADEAGGVVARGGDRPVGQGHHAENGGRRAEADDLTVWAGELGEGRERPAGRRGRDRGATGGCLEDDHGEHGRQQRRQAEPAEPEAAVVEAGELGAGRAQHQRVSSTGWAW